MDETEVSEFLQAVRVPALDDALALALTLVDKFDGPRWFGQIGDGTFYADFNRSIWFSDTCPAEAVCLLKTRLGEDMTDDLENFWKAE